MKLRIKQVVTPIKIKWVLEKQDQLGMDWVDIIHMDDFASCREYYLDEILHYMNNHVVSEELIEETDLTKIEQIEKWHHQLIVLPTEEDDCGCHDSEHKIENNGKKSKRTTK